LAFSPDGRLAVAAGWKPSLLRIWNIESGELRALDTRAPGENCDWGKDWEGSIVSMEFLADGRLLTTGAAGVRSWDLDNATSQQIRPCTVKGVESYLATDFDHRVFLVLDVNANAQQSALSLYDPKTGSFREIHSHGNRVYIATLDPTGTIAVTGSFDGVVRVGPVTGEEPHRLYGHTLEVSSIAVSPNGKWIASGSQDGTIRLWPMPEGPPFHTLPYEEILERIRTLTNLRVVPDESSDTGYRVEIGPFPGWKKLPNW
jgi:WD40 repeat protein